MAGKIHVYITRLELKELEDFDEYTDYMAVWQTDNGYLVFSSMIYSDDPFDRHYVFDDNLVVKTDNVILHPFGL